MAKLVFLDSEPLDLASKPPGKTDADICRSWLSMLELVGALVLTPLLCWMKKFDPRSSMTPGDPWRPLETPDPYFDQSSTARPGTRLKSERLPVTTVALSSRPIAAMHKSFLPTFSLRALSWRYS